jgi:transposase
VKDTELYAQMLGIAKPWEVKEVKLDVSGKKVEVRLACAERTWWGTEAGERLPVHDHVERSWRHLDTMQFETVLTARVPRVKYPDGKVETVRVPWAEKGGRFTLLFEAWAVTVLLASATVEQGRQLLRLSWEAAHRIMARAVERGLASRKVEELPYVGLDEKSFRKGQSYISTLTDVVEGRVLEVVEGRDQASGEALWQSLPEAQRLRVEAAAMDLAAGFAAATRVMAPQAEIVHDKFHVSSLLSEAVDEVRRQEHRVLSEQGDDRLKGTRQDWLFNPENLNDERSARFAALAGTQLKTARGWYHKDFFRVFWQSQSQWEAEGFFRRWYAGAMRCRLEPIKRAARTLKAHVAGLYSYVEHPITNAVTEGLNSRIQSLKRTARGLRSFANYRTRILFFCGGLNLQPL